MPENTAKGVSSNTFAINVEQSTQQFNAQYKPLNSGIVELNQKETLLKYQALHSPPVTPVRVDRLEYLLHCYEQNKKHFLVDGFRCGFRVNFVGDRLPFQSPNLKSVLAQPEIARMKLRKECDAGRIVGPFKTPPFANFRTSPLGVVPKKDPSEFRLIHHSSYPKGNLVNDAIPDYCSSVKYASVSDAITAIKATGEGCFLAKTDIKSAFRIIPIHPADYSLLGMKFDNLYYFDRCLPMGLSSSCNIFEAFSTALEWLSIHRLGASSVLHILDDFLFIAKTKDRCEADLGKFISLCHHLGVPLAPEKTVGPDTVLQFAGITLDSVRREARLPDEKLQKCRMLLHNFYTRRTVKLKELQSLIGLLNFTCQVIVPGRAFLRRLIDLTKGVRQPHHHIRLCKGSKQDLLLWMRFLDEFNGKSFFLEDTWETSHTLELYTDAAGSIGFGAVFGKHWFGGEWPVTWKSYNIAVLELLPIVLAIHIWGHLMADKCVIFFTDNHRAKSLIYLSLGKY